MREMRCGPVSTRGGRDCLRKLCCGHLLDRRRGELGIVVRVVLCRNLPNRVGRIDVHFVFGEHLDGRGRVQHSVRGVFGREVHGEYGRFRVRGLRVGQLFRCQRKCLRLVQRWNLLGDFGDIKLFELRARGELSRGVERLLGLLGGHLPGRIGRFELPELRPWFILRVGRKCLFGLLSGNLPGSHGSFQLQ